MKRAIRLWWHWTLQGLKMYFFLIIPTIVAQLIGGIGLLLMSIGGENEWGSLWTKVLFALGIPFFLLVPAAFSTMLYIQLSDHPLRAMDEPSPEPKVDLE